MKQWEGFKGDKWRTSVDTRDFIQNNYTEYKGDDSFLEPIARALTNYGQNYKNYLKSNMKKWRL